MSHDSRHWKHRPDRERGPAVALKVFAVVNPDQLSGGLPAEQAEFVALTFAVMETDSWNRLAISCRPVVGAYESPHTAVRVTA